MIKVEVGDFVVVEMKRGDVDVCLVTNVTEKSIVVTNHRKEKFFIPVETLCGMRGKILPDLSFAGGRSEMIRVDISRFSKTGKCDACDEGFISNFGEFIPRTQTVFVFNIGEKKINLCPDCFNRLRMSMMFPNHESLDEYRVGKLKSDDITFDVDLFFELMSELEKEDPDLEDVSRILRGRRKKE